MSIEIRCPACDETLTLAKPADKGKRLRCPECDHAFTLGGKAKAKPRPAAGGMPKWAPFAIGGGVIAVVAVVLVLVLGRGEKQQAQAPDPQPVVVPPVVPPVNPIPSPPDPQQPVPPKENPPQPVPPKDPPVRTPGDKRLLEVATYDRTPIPAKPGDPYLLFDDADPYHGARPSAGTGLLRQALYRQGVLLAARDELGLTVRDAAIGEVPPHGLPTSQRVRVTYASIKGSTPRQVMVQVGGDADLKAVWAAESEIDVAETPLEALATAEGFSRGGYLTALRRVGGWTPARPRRSEAAVPAAAEKALGRMTVASQLAAVRALHEAVRKDGESSALLGALVRGYANLGLLTDRLWDGTTWAFKARGLLYAERLRNLPAVPAERAARLWHRAYALALAGLHADALADFEAAGLVPGVWPGMDWAALARSLVRSDVADLRDRAGKAGDWAETAALFHYLVLEGPAFPNAALAAGAAFLKKVPGCHRVRDGLARIGGVGHLHGATTDGLLELPEVLRADLTTAPGLPDNVAQLARADTDFDALARALTESGRDKADRAEPSWAVMGRVAVESRLTLADARVGFLRFVLAAPAGPFLENVRPALGGHPMFPILEAVAGDSGRRPEEFLALLKKVPAGYLSWRQFGALARSVQPANPAHTKYLGLVKTHGETLAPDLTAELAFRARTAPSAAAARQLLAASPHSPAARAHLIEFDRPSLTPGQAFEWEANSQHPVVAVAFGRQALKAGQEKEAVRHYERSLTLSKEIHPYTVLAELRLRQGDEKKWLELLEEALKLPASGLEHAQVRVSVARHYLKAGKPADARKYADAAAETGAEWAMRCAADCAEAAGDFAAAEEWMQRVSGRYASVAGAWYLWCVRTGKGDVRAARRLADDRLQAMGQLRAGQDYTLNALLLLADGRAKQAADLLAEFKPAVAKYDLPLVLAAAIRDGLGDTAGRDRALKAIPDGGDHAAVAKLLLAAVAGGEKTVPTGAEIEAVLKPLTAATRLSAAYAVGEFARRRGKADVAKKYLELAAVPAQAPTSVSTTPQPDPVIAVLASLALRAKK